MIFNERSKKDDGLSRSHFWLTFAWWGDWTLQNQAANQTEVSFVRLDQSEQELPCLLPMIKKLDFGPIRNKSAKYDDDSVHIQSPFWMWSLCLLHFRWSSLNFQPQSGVFYQRFWSTKQVSTDVLLYSVHRGNFRRMDGRKEHIIEIQSEHQAWPTCLRLHFSWFFR